MVMLKDIELAERRLRLLICTWNVGNASARPNELTHWLPEAGGDLDLVVVGVRRRVCRLPGGQPMPKSARSS